jgi:hypothetical protein
MTVEKEKAAGKERKTQERENKGQLKIKEKANKNTALLRCFFLFIWLSFNSSVLIFK